MAVLYIRDGNGNFVPIPAIKGASAYDQAKLGGYRGTEAEFIALLNGLTKGEQLIEVLYKSGKLTDEEYNEIINGDTA